jgi:hypothetical protein
VLDLVQPRIATWWLRRFRGQAGRDEAARQGHALAYTALPLSASIQRDGRSRRRRRGYVGTAPSLRSPFVACCLAAGLQRNPIRLDRRRTRDFRRAIEFYTQQLGFQLAFRDEADPPNYVGFRRDMQFQFEYEMGTIRLRFLVEDQTRSSTNIGNVVSSALLTALIILYGGRVSLPSMTWIATHSLSIET